MQMTPHKQKWGILHFCVLRSCSPNIVTTEPFQQKDESLVLETAGDEHLLGDRHDPGRTATAAEPRRVTEADTCQAEAVAAPGGGGGGWGQDPYLHGAASLIGRFTVTISAISYY